ncbi:hypothetical protein AMATHDRAFT_72816 [Amanita thiersii Skay4041]|uniref:Intradiol ring-cleavage dioxygenases domain-containing protein n=1 Tax=Amanita thiersii Skay4041 TaxID=703135 RepID=A0A2A9P112_9AGAR|nr:hypothetical protein AMATHDRAFT_72816 [Amanita thiersii Skay4041]
MAGFVSAYPTEKAEGLVTRDCSAEIERFNLARREKRGHLKRSLYSNMQNLTCVLSPEVPKQNYVAGAPLQSDVIDGQEGVLLVLDVGILDVTTCQPMPNALVEIWSTNAFGDYGSFLRGATVSESNGIAEFQTIFPGFTSTSANHINIAVHSGSSMTSSTSHNGQLFFTDKWTYIVGMYPPYDQNTHTWIFNDNDSNYAAASQAGFDPIVDLLSIQDDWPQGIVGYITVGINPNNKVN